MAPSEITWEGISSFLRKVSIFLSAEATSCPTTLVIYSMLLILDFCAHLEDERIHGLKTQVLFTSVPCRTLPFRTFLSSVHHLPKKMNDEEKEERKRRREARKLDRGKNKEEMEVEEETPKPKAKPSAVPVIASEKDLLELAGEVESNSVHTKQFFHIQLQDKEFLALQMKIKEREDRERQEREEAEKWEEEKRKREEERKKRRGNRGGQKSGDSKLIMLSFVTNITVNVIVPQILPRHFSL